MSGRLEGKIAIVTGGGRGIGRAITEAFAAEGARVVIASRKQEKLDEAAEEMNETWSEAVVGKSCHVGKPDQIEALLEWTFDNVGVPDILVNNSATNPYFGPMMGAEIPAWDKTFEVNLKGPFLLTKGLAARWMSEGQGGTVVNITSILGMGAAPLQGIYGMTKAAVISLTRTLAVELGGADIRINAIAPGLVDTRFAAAITGSDSLSNEFTSKTALGRIAEPQEIGGLAVYLASDESSFVTGQVYRVDGGYNLG